MGLSLDFPVPLIYISVFVPRAISNVLILLPTGRDKRDKGTGGKLGAGLLRDVGTPWSGSHTLCALLLPWVSLFL